MCLLQPPSVLAMDSERLKLSSRKWMIAAFIALAEGPSSHDLAVHHAGIAAEHLLKSYLASLHPALVVEGKDFNSLLHATGHGSHASVPAEQVKTIGLAEAHARAQKILRKKMPVDQRALGPLANARNGVAHSGMYDRSEVNAVFTTCLRLIDPLLVELKINNSYWGGYESLHDRLLEENVEAVRVRLESKLARAKDVFTERYGHMPQKERELVLGAIARVFPPGGNIEHDELVTCPACDSQGWLSGDKHVDEDEWAVMFTPFVFSCPACDLLVEHEELEELEGLAEEVKLDESPNDFYADWEPAEVLYRDR
ncbi:hypothetical protein GCM10009753_18920 [Streptantibioticus ferralitis]